MGLDVLPQLRPCDGSFFGLMCSRLGSGPKAALAYAQRRAF